MPEQNWYSIKNAAAADEAAEVLIYDEIGAWGVDAKSLVNEIGGIGAQTINVRLNTPGGSVFDGTAIHNALKAHPARVVMHVEGVAASAGSFIMLAGDEVRMADNAYVMIHDSAGGVMGGADDMRGYAELLDKIDGNIAAMYSRKTGKPAEHYRALMDAETWFTADEAKAEGLVDTVYTAKPAQAARASNAARFATIYNKIPDAVRQLWGVAPAAAATQQTNTPAPEDSPCGDPPPAQLQETSHMAESTQAAAPTPAANVTPTPAPAAVAAPAAPAAKPLTAQEEIRALNHKTMQAAIDSARGVGKQEGEEAAVERAKAIRDVCPGRPDMALDAFINKQTPAEVKATFDAVAKAQADAARERENMEREIARLRSELATGGYPRGLPVGLGIGEPEAEQSDGPVDAAAARAEADHIWTYKPAMRKGFTSKERFVAVHVAERTGKFRTHKTSGDRA